MYPQLSPQQYECFVQSYSNTILVLPVARKETAVATFTVIHWEIPPLKG